MSTDPLARYQLAFSNVTASTRTLSAALSPNGEYLVVSRCDGSVYLFKTATGLMLGKIKFGFNHRVTHFLWLNCFQLILGNAKGEIQLGTLLENPVNQKATKLISLLTVVNQSQDRILALAYDPTARLVAYATQQGFFILRVNLELMKCRLIERRVTPPTGGEICALQFFGTEPGKFKRLFVALNKGAVIWTGPSQPLTQLKLGGYTISDCTVSADGTLVAIVTTDLHVVMWSMVVAGPDLSNGHIFKIPTGRYLLPGLSDAPICFRPDNTLLTSDPLGRVYVLSSHAKEVGSVSFGNCRLISSISVYGSLLYLVSTDHVNNLHIDAYTDSSDMIRSLRVCQNLGNVHQQGIPVQQQNRQDPAAKDHGPKRDPINVWHTLLAILVVIAFLTSSSLLSARIKRQHYFEPVIYYRQERKYQNRERLVYGGKCNVYMMF